VHAANLRWLSGYRHPLFAQPELAARLGEVFVGGAPLLGGAAVAGDPVAVLPVLFGMLWRGRLTAEVERDLLGPATLRTSATAARATVGIARLWSRPGERARPAAGAGTGDGIA
jgi:hypothetical protein